MLRLDQMPVPQLQRALRPLQRALRGLQCQQPLLLLLHAQRL